jgi:cyclopropane fatty-acyl-phospholipid synthase-like methyltransferase
MAAEWWETFFEGPWLEHQHRGFPPEQTSREVDFILGALGLEPGAKVLDMPCGEGRHSIEMAARGFRSVGVDFKEDTLEVARERAVAQGVDVEFVRADMRGFSAEGLFDGAICYGGSFGFFDEEGNLEVLEAFARALKPEGILLLDAHVAESLFPQFRERDWSWQGEGDHRTQLLQERRFDLRTRRVEAIWTTITKEGPISNPVSIRIYAYRELEDLLRVVGFRDFDARATGTGEPFAFGSPRLALIARK